MMKFFGLIIGFCLGALISCLYVNINDEDLNSKKPSIIIAISIVICIFIGNGLDNDISSSRPRSYSTNSSYSSSSNYSSSSRDENGLKKKECPVCHNEFTDADNKKSLRLYNMCEQCKKNYDTAQQMLGN